MLLEYIMNEEQENQLNNHSQSSNHRNTDFKLKEI